MHVFGGSNSQSQGPIASNKAKNVSKKGQDKDAFDRIVSLCSIRDRSWLELKQRLERDGYNASEANEALDRALQCGLVDDRRFADAFIRGRTRAGKGEAVIARDLAKHGIDLHTLVGWPDDYDMDDSSQISRAVDLLRSNPPRAKDAYQAAYRKLINRGYSQAIASRAVRIWHENTE